ncbi:MAG: hypothetical protein ACRD3M_15500 [Thermoanaerobaculia bacterium]
MDTILPVIAVAALALACPLGMVGMGVAAWVIARARGQKKELSVGCMPGHGEQPAARGEDGALQEQVARLEREVESLRTKVPGRSES